MMNVYFWLAYAVIIISAIVALEASSLLWAAVSFVILLSEIALLYFGLGMPILGGIQLAIYAGGVTVLILFAIMMIGESYKKPPEKHPIAMVLSLLIVLFGTVIAFKSAIDTFKFKTFEVSEYGKNFSGKYAIFTVFLALIVSSILYMANTVISKKRRQINDTP